MRTPYRSIKWTNSTPWGGGVDLEFIEKKVVDDFGLYTAKAIGTYDYDTYMIAKSNIALAFSVTTQWNTSMPKQPWMNHAVIAWGITAMIYSWNNGGQAYDVYVYKINLPTTP